MRVLHVIDSFAVGGAESSLLELVRAQKWTASVAGLYASDTLLEEFRRAGAETFHLGSPKAWGLLDAARWLRNVVRRARPDLLHTSLYRSGLVSRVVGLGAGVPVIDSFVNDSYGMTRLRGRALSERMRIRAIQVPDRLLSGIPRLYISNSRAVAETNSAALGVPMERIRVVPRGRDPSAFRRSDAARRSIRGELGLSGPVIVHVGRFGEAKEHETLVEAFSSLTADARLVLVGDGPRKELVRALVRARGLEGRVVFAGTRRDVASVLSAADVFAFPSRYEGWPGALLEAMMAGVPVVASDLPVHREIDGGYGAITFFPMGDARSLSAKLSALLEDEPRAAALGQLGLGRAEQFSVDAMVRGHLAAYEEALRGAR